MIPVVTAAGGSVTPKLEEWSADGRVRGITMCGGVARRRQKNVTVHKSAED